MNKTIIKSSIFLLYKFLILDNKVYKLKICGSFRSACVKPYQIYTIDQLIIYLENQIIILSVSSLNII